MPPSRPQSPTAITSLGAGVASQVRRSASAMFRVTGPVTSRQSAWRGEATPGRPVVAPGAPVDHQDAAVAGPRDHLPDRQGPAEAPRDLGPEAVAHALELE